MAAPSNTVILGAGIIGVSTAYYLSSSGRTLPNSIHLIKASPTLFASASGYAGGFLAKDWFGPATGELGDLSYKLHKKLAAEHDGKQRWGYSVTTSVESKYPPWVAKKQGRSIETISGLHSTAVVDPLKLCKFLLGECLDRGVRLHQPAKAISVSKDMRGELASVRIAKNDDEEMDLPCSRIVIAAGAWSPEVFSAIFTSSSLKIPIAPLAGHSLVVRSPRWTSDNVSDGCHAVYTTTPDGLSPEFYARPNGDIYIAGLNDTQLSLPKLATDAEVDQTQIQRLKKIAVDMFGGSQAPNELDVVREGLCFRPVTVKGPPLLCRIDDSHLGADFLTRAGKEGGVFISAGHGPWGIAQSLGTGKVLSELIEDQKLSADVSMLTLS